MAKKTKDSDKDFKIEFNTPYNMDSKYATNFTIELILDYFKISFYEIKPDLILSPQDRKKFEQRGTVRADCLGSFILTRDNVEKLNEMIADQLSDEDIP